MKKFILGATLSLFVTAANAAGSIILLIDTSSSMSTEEVQLQVDSYISSVSNIYSLKYVHIETIIFNDYPTKIASGSVEDTITGLNSLKVLPDEYRGSTCLNKALLYVEKMVTKLPEPVILDISGDGEANCNDRFEVPATLNRLENLGVRVNTLYINNSFHDAQVQETLRSFYKSLVRNNGFSIEAQGYEDFELALYEKLILEISMLKVGNPNANSID